MVEMGEAGGEERGAEREEREEEEGEVERSKVGGGKRKWRNFEIERRPL